ncbi:MAG TPA: PAS domain S-box protein [candidate division Zixibacteria bacterium]|nr:PAS domain S-box protein [candidate division Zixibacteria bacterium]MDD4918767.1 PAS domain S-box protein [candidate division Zixibacteria bacterium]MDM7974296.1 PAS domain S-box protein [candidate division Zixibacteria bacterium]HOD66266.1 PAS domain S-box protein [candidate division Zixibacteria bacterium]HPM37036.1 PAS domain S-box protein [candidate division Zixibacteria bacterium]
MHNDEPQGGNSAAPQGVSPDLSARDAGLLLEQAGIGLMVMDPAGTIRYANNAAPHLLGIEAGLVGRPMRDLLPLREHPRLAEILAAPGEDQPDAEWRILLSEPGGRGPQREIALEYSWLRTGADRRLYATVRAIGGSAARDAGSSRVSGTPAPELDYRAIADCAYDWETWIGLDGRLVWVNPAVHRITGYTQEECLVMADYPDALLHPDDRARMVRSFQGAMRGSTGNDIEFRVLRKDGRSVWVAVSWQPILSSAGVLLGHRSTIRDIGRRKAVEEELRESRRQLSTLLSNLPGMVYRSANEPEWPMDFVSDGCCALTGCEASEIMSGQVPYGNLIHPDDKQMVWDAVQAGITIGRPFQIRYRIVRKDGAVRWVWEQGRMVEMEGGRSALEGFIADITVPKLAEEELRRREQQYRSVVDSSPMGMHLYRLEPDGRLVFEGANPAADLILGVCNEKFLGMTIDEAFPQLAQTEVPQRYRQTAAHGVTWQTEQLTYQDERITGAFHVVAFQTAPGRMAAMFEDITERKRTQDALRESEHRFRLAFRTIPDAVAISRFDTGVFVEINEGFTANTGYTRDDVVGVPADQVRVWVDPRVREHLVRMLFERGHMENLEAEFRRKDGTVLVGLMSACLLTLNGRPHILSVTRNIQDLKDTQEALRREMERAQQYLDVAATLMMAVADDGRVLMVNRKGADLLGYREEQLIGRSWIRDLLADEDQEQTEATFQKVVSGRMQGLDYYECRVVTASGEKRLIAWYLTDFRDRHGAIRGILTSGIDITERRRMEEEMQRIYEQLEHEHDALQKKNIALREVLGQIEGEKDAIKRLVVANIESDIVPTVQRLRGMASEPQGPLLDLLEDSLAHIASEFAAGLKERFHGLTPRQVQICRLIKNGYSSKEIAESIGTSLLTVHKHREAIRDKLGLKNRNISLNSYLQTL